MQSGQVLGLRSQPGNSALTQTRPARMGFKPSLAEEEDSHCCRHERNQVPMNTSSARHRSEADAHQPKSFPRWRLALFDLPHAWRSAAGMLLVLAALQAKGREVVLRPGPYSCAEWDFGGFPFWLLKIPDLKSRTMDPHFRGQPL